MAWHDFVDLFYYIFGSIVIFLTETQIFGIPIIHYFLFFAIIGAIISVFVRSAKF